MLVLAMSLCGKLKSQNQSDSIMYGVDSIIPSYIPLSTSHSSVTKVKRNVSVSSWNSFLHNTLNLDSDISLVLQDSSSGHLYYTQYYKNVPIKGTRYGIHFKNGEAESINGNFRTIRNLDVQPTILEEVALQKALEHIGAEQYAWESADMMEWLKINSNNIDATYYPRAELCIYADRNAPVLTYKFNIFALRPLSRQLIYINAHSGEVVATENQLYAIEGNAATRYSGVRKIHTERVANGYRLHDTTRGSGICTYNVSGKDNFHLSNIEYIDSDNNWSAAEWHNTTKDDAALNFHWAAEMTFDYFKNKHQRNSYDNQGSIIKGYVNATFWGLDKNKNVVDISDNAYWDPNDKILVFGKGVIYDPVASLDAVAHEISHGVCSSTANLVYEGEPGALNEGFSDIWAACVEHYAIPEKGNNIWRIGEDLGYPPLRYMDYPKNRRSPDTYLGQYWQDTNPSSDDNGGVHYNSGVLNHWFYLLTVGGCSMNDNNKAYLVSGIGIDKAAKIAYRTLTVYLNSTSNFTETRFYSIKSAQDLYGSNSDEALQVTNAWHAVGIGNPVYNYQIVDNGIKQPYYVDRLPAGATVKWEVNSANFVIENVSGNKVTLASKEYGISTTLTAKVYYGNTYITSASKQITSSVLDVEGSGHISCCGLKAHRIGYLPYGATFSWNVSDNVDIDSQKGDSIRVSTVKGTSSGYWIEAVVHANGKTYAKRKTLLLREKEKVDMEFLSDSRGPNGSKRFAIYADPIDNNGRSMRDIPEETIVYWRCRRSPDSKTETDAILESEDLITNSSLIKVPSCMKSSTIRDSISIQPSTFSVYPVDPPVDPFPPVKPWDTDDIDVTKIDSPHRLKVTLPNDNYIGIVTCSVFSQCTKTTSLNYMVDKNGISAYKDEGMSPFLYSTPPYRVTSSNPTSDFVSIRKVDMEENSSSLHEVKLMLYNDYGLVRTVNGTSEEETLQMNISDLPKGTYYLNVVTGNDIIKQVVRIEH